MTDHICEFTEDWVGWPVNRLPDWEEWLARFVGKPCRALEIGSHEVGEL